MAISCLRITVFTIIIKCSQSTTNKIRFSNLFISVRRSTCFRLAGAQNCTYNVRHLSDRYCHLLLAAGRARLKCDGTRAETRFGLSAQRTSPFKLVGGQFSRLLAAEVCASAVVMVAMLDTPCSEVKCKTTGYTLHSHVSPSLLLPCVTVCHQVSTEL